MENKLVIKIQICRYNILCKTNFNFKLLWFELYVQILRHNAAHMQCLYKGVMSCMLAVSHGGMPVHFLMLISPFAAFGVFIYNKGIISFGGVCVGCDWAWF